MNTIDEMVEVLQAYRDGKTIQAFDEDKKWFDCYMPMFNFHKNTYRVKPEAKKFYVTALKDYIFWTSKAEANLELSFEDGRLTAAKVIGD